MKACNYSDVYQHTFSFLFQSSSIAGCRIEYGGGGEIATLYTYQVCILYRKALSIMTITMNILTIAIFIPPTTMSQLSCLIATCAKKL